MVLSETSRRKVLQAFGTMAVGGGLSVGTASARKSNVSSPVLAKGTRTIRQVPTDDGYIREEEFEINEAEPVSTTVKDGTVTLTTDSRERNPDLTSNTTVNLGRQVMEVDEREIKAKLSEKTDIGTSLKGTKLDIIQRDAPKIVTYKDTAILGTIKQHYDLEMRAREALVATKSTLLESNPLLDSDCSIYTFKGDNPSNPDDLGERRGPINIAWDNGKDASEINSAMQEEGWGSLWPSGTRYIIVNDYTVRAQDKHIKKNIYPGHLPNQWHVRAYDLPGYVDDLEVIGSGHRDPIDHGKVCGPVPDCDTDWGISDTRQEVSAEWTEVTTKYSGTDSGSGNYDYIEGDIDDDEDDDVPSCPPFCPI